jgi:hypothetical protein
MPDAAFIVTAASATVGSITAQNTAAQNARIIFFMFILQKDYTHVTIAAVAARAGVVSVHTRTTTTATAAAYAVTAKSSSAG